MTALRDMHKDDKPREKLVAKGVQALKNEELLSVLLGSGVQGKEIVILMDTGFDELSLHKLCDIHGLGIAKASQILASIERSKRYLIKSNKRITSADEVYDELKTFSNKSQEHFLTITLDGASHIINTRTVFIGTLNQSLVHPIMKLTPVGANPCVHLLNQKYISNLFSCALMGEHLGSPLQDMDVLC